MRVYTLNADEADGRLPSLIKFPVMVEAFFSSPMARQAEATFAFTNGDPTSRVRHPPRSALHPGDDVLTSRRYPMRIVGRTTMARNVRDHIASRPLPSAWRRSGCAYDITPIYSSRNLASTHGAKSTAAFDDVDEMVKLLELLHVQQAGHPELRARVSGT